VMFIVRLTIREGSLIATPASLQPRTKSLKFFPIHSRVFSASITVHLHVLA